MVAIFRVAKWEFTMFISYCILVTNKIPSGPGSKSISSYASESETTIVKFVSLVSQKTVKEGVRRLYISR